MITLFLIIWLSLGLKSQVFEQLTQQTERKEPLANFDKLIQLQQKNIEEKIDFLGLDLLKETLHSIPKERHRQAFLDGFKVLLSEDKINSLSVCWKRMYY